MNTSRWQSIKDLLHQALLLAPGERNAFLDHVCSSDPSLRSEVESLLAADDSVRTSFMQAPPLPGANIPGVDTAFSLEPGQIIAQRFQLLRLLGEGGMGQVWLADQLSPVRRQVALKLIKAGMYDQSLVQRFQSERQSLAIMDHPAIAKVFDAGATDQGQPYFVMEYVPGLPITDYCDQKKLTIAQRLQLFIQACEGVQHAHQKGILHRDLKPANILVVEIDGKPVPRIIDFGLAKGTAPDADDSLTRVGAFVGTPRYMSPEQADPGGQDLDARTDVYSLGVILYILLTGELPLDLNPRNQPLAEVLRKLREEEPSRPSAKVSMVRSTAAAAATARATEPRQLLSQLRGDLDWITVKALEKDRARRYGTPAELAADLQRYLQGEPVTARKATFTYRSGRFLHRHRESSLAVAIALCIIAALLAVSYPFFRRSNTKPKEKDAAALARATLRSPWDASAVTMNDVSYSCPPASSLPTDLAQHKEAVASIEDFSRAVVRAADTFQTVGSRAAGQCVISLLGSAAGQNALTAEISDGQAIREQGSNLAAWAVAFLKVRGSKLATEDQGQKITAWLTRLATVNRAYYDARRMRAGQKETYGHQLYWAGFAVAAVAVANNDKDLFQWAMDTYKHAVSQIQPDGTLPLEMERGPQALRSHLYALASLVMLAEFGEANGFNLYAEGNFAMKRLVAVCVDGLRDPGFFQRQTGVAQAVEPEIQPWAISWAQPYTRRFPDPGISQLLAKAPRLSYTMLGGLPPH